MSSRKDQLREAKQRERLRMSEEKKEELRQAARLRMAASNNDIGRKRRKKGKG